MPKGSKQKLKLYYLSQIMLEKTDEDHFLSLAEIQRFLEEEGVSADRKTLYDDLEELSILGITIDGEKFGRNYKYHVVGKQFELAELKLLVDAIQSSKFITEKKSNELIGKLTHLSSVYEARQLKRQVIVRGRIKSMNETIYYSVDSIHNAINENKCISFEYYRWNLKGKLEKRENPFYEVSPWALTWDDENYYLIAYDLKDQKEKHFRVDKMKNLKMTDKIREGMDLFKSYDLASFAKMSFGMFGGEHKKVTVDFKDELVGVFIDRFGKDIMIIPSEEKGWSKTFVEVAVSPQFFGWIYALGTGVKITGPDDVVKDFKNHLNDMSKFYKE